MKKITILSSLLAVIILGVILKGSIRVGAANVTIDSNLAVSPNVISFSTVFPGEVHFKPLTIDLSSQFIASRIHDDVEYRILQKPKPRVDSPQERAYCQENPTDYERCYPSLCPYLSKTADGIPANDTSVPAFHNPDDPSSIAYGRLAKSDNDVKDDWVIDLHTPCFKGQCDQSGSVAAEYQLDPQFQGEVLGCDLVVEVVSISFNEECATCERDQSGNPVTVEVNSNVTIDFTTPVPTYSGDPSLQPYFSYDKSGATPDTWKAIFTLGGKALTVKPGVTITTTPVGQGNNKYAPGIEISSTCEANLQKNGAIIVNSLNKKAGDIVIEVDGNITIDGEVRNEVSGTNDLPGEITIASKCGDIVQGDGSIVQILGIDNGGNDINILACQEGNIATNGLVMSRAKAHTPPVTQNRPNVNVVAFGGSVTINASTTAPLYNEYSYAGGKYDLWGGLLSWVTHNTNPGNVRIQAKQDITVNGHGRDNRRSFGAVAAVTNTSDQHGGIIDARSLEGKITGTNRAFDVSGENKGGTNVAKINLEAANSIALTRPGATSDFNPVVDASATSGNSKGGKNFIHSYQQGITNGFQSLVSALATGTNSVSGTNNLTSCTGITNNGSITPPDANSGDNTGMCAPAAPAALFPGCQYFLP